MPAFVFSTPPGDAFDLERTKKALHGRVVPDLAGPAHAASDGLFIQQPLLAGVLAALIRVMLQGHRLARRHTCSPA